MSGLPSDMKSLMDTTEEMDIKQKIVEELLINNRNLETKTELSKPISWACMSMIEEVLEGKEMSFSAGLLKSFSKTAFTYLISKDRKGRNEYIEALKSLSAMNPVIPKIDKLMER